MKHIKTETVVKHQLEFTSEELLVLKEVLTHENAIHSQIGNEILEYVDRQVD